MKWKIAIAIIAIAAVIAVLFATTASAITTNTDQGNTAISKSYRWWHFWSEDDGRDNFWEGWWPFSQNSNRTVGYDDWGWHE